MKRRVFCGRRCLREEVLGGEGTEAATRGPEGRQTPRRMFKRNHSGRSHVLDATRQDEEAAAALNKRRRLESKSGK